MSFDTATINAASEQLKAKWDQAMAELEALPDDATDETIAAIVQRLEATVAESRRGAAALLGEAE